MATLRLKREANVPAGVNFQGFINWHAVAAMHAEARRNRSQTNQLDGSLRTPDGTPIGVFAGRRIPDGFGI